MTILTFILIIIIYNSLEPKDLATSGMTMMLVTHEMQAAYEVSDQVVFLHQGKIEEQVSPEALLKDPQSKRLQEFLKTSRI